MRSSPRSKPSTSEPEIRRVAVYLDASDYRRVRAVLIRRKLSVSAWIRETIRGLLDEIDG